MKKFEAAGIFGIGISVGVVLSGILYEAGRKLGGKSYKPIEIMQVELNKNAEALETLIRLKNDFIDWVVDYPWNPNMQSGDIDAFFSKMIEKRKYMDLAAKGLDVTLEDNPDKES